MIINGGNYDHYEGQNKDVEIVIKEPNNSIIDELYGIAFNVQMTLDEIRNERLKGDKILPRL